MHISALHRIGIATCTTSTQCSAIHDDLTSSVSWRVLVEIRNLGLKLAHVLETVRVLKCSR